MSDRICLIVDDDAHIRSLIGLILEQKGLRTLEAENAAEAFSMVQRLDGRLDLIITDIVMPGNMDGLDLAHSVREWFPKIPIILISGYAAEDRVTSSEFSFVAKPFGAEAIWKVVEQVLNFGEESPPAKG